MYSKILNAKKTIPTEAGNNFCSDHDSDENGAWCYTISTKMRWEYCDVKYNCEDGIEFDVSQKVLPLDILLDLLTSK